MIQLVIVLLACTRTNGLDPVNKSSAGLALRGYDTVAYYTENNPVPGNEQYRHTWNGARWHFVSAENRDAFVRNPERYAPQYGGYCAYAVSHGYTADGPASDGDVIEIRQVFEITDFPQDVRKAADSPTVRKQVEKRKTS
jgi:YHS domain-containing protein